MRLCQPYLSALARSFFAVWLLSGVIISSWLVAAIAAAQIIDARLALAPTASLLPLATIITIAIAGALVVHMARGTLLNRRRIWLAHGLGEAVLAHETWLNSDTKQRTRSLAAVETIAQFTGSPAATALSETPWAVLVICGLWAIDINIASVATMALVVMLTFALSGCRMSRGARQFDTAHAAQTLGHDIMRDGCGDANASLDHARRVAGRWENTQRAHMAASYAQTQAHERRRILVVALNAVTLGALIAVACASTDGAVTLGTLVASCAVASGALYVVSCWAAEAFVCASARAAKRQLGTLRVARTRGGEARLPSIARPDLRAPIAAGVFATAATAAALAGAAIHWQLPVSKLIGVTVAAIPSELPLRSASDHVRELDRLKADLANQKFRLGELRQEAETLQNAGATEAQSPTLKNIEAVARGLTASMTAMLGRIETLERDLKSPPAAMAAPRSNDVALSKGVS